MIAVIMGAVASSISSARERAKIQKATAEVKAVSQAILAYENWARGSGTYELPTMDRADADSGSLSFLLGKGPSAKSGGRIPVMLMAALESGGAMKDPWGTTYKVTIKETSVTPKWKTATGSMQTGYYLPNFYNLTEDER